ncbi:SWIM zinc finger family protein [Gloeothece verrucosa]|uniref:SWIM zinc finger family protein n=1 Tax=Gloeothece verrucosa TaxID=2546359 RepID=UPI00030927D0
MGRGRSYARNGKIKEYYIENGKITALVRGSINPYFGVYKEPLYNINIEIKPISATDWSKALSYIGSKASWVSKLLMNEVPDNIEEAFSKYKLHLLPYSSKDFKTNCSCPDWENPCKHIAGVYYLVASELDQDPFLLFELRGISRSQLQQELAKTPLGKILSDAMNEQEIELEAVDSYYTQPRKVKASLPCSPKDFWHGEKRLPQTVPSASTGGVSAIVVKKGGEFPPFWKKDTSFIEVMEDFYQRVRTKNKGAF